MRKPYTTPALLGLGSMDAVTRKSGDVPDAEGPA